MIEIIKGVITLAVMEEDYYLLDILIKCIDDDIKNEFKNNIQKLNDDDLDRIIGLLRKAGYSYKAIEQILNGQ